MPAAPTAAPPPTSKPASVTIVDTPPPKPPPAPTSTINVSQMGTSAAPPAQGKRGSAMDRMTEALRKKAASPTPSSGQDSPPTPVQSKAPASQSEPASTNGDAPSQSPGASPSTEGEASANAPEGSAEGADTPAAQPAAKPADKGKPSPWKLVDQYKAQTVTLQKEIADLRAQITPETDRKALMERVEKSETLAKQLSDEIRYHNYEKSPEFAEKFHAPYEAEFRRHLEDLSEVTIVDEASGVARKITGDDLAQLAFMNFAQAKEVANRLFPDFANDIMTARKDIRAAWDKRQNALKEWKEKGSQREQQMREQTMKQRSEMEQFIRQTWEKSNAEVTGDEKHGQYFRPIEGDEEWNKRLSKGFELVDKSYSENPASPQLTPEQRAQAVKRHAAVRARAAGWGALRFRNDQLTQKIAALEQELAQFKATTPATSGTENAPAASANAVPSRAMDRMQADLRKFAK